MNKAANILGLFLLSGVALAACDNEPGAGKPAAKVSEAVSATEEPTEKPTDQTAKHASEKSVLYAFSNADSKLEFVGAKVTGKHDGSFNDFSGNITVPASGVDDGNVKVEIVMGSVESDNDKLTNHLKSADFFDVEKFPKATFESTKFEKSATGYDVTGNLELHGVKKSITFPATITQQGDRVTVNADFAINRKDFDIVYPGMPDDLIKDDVNLKLTINAKRNSGS